MAEDKAMNDPERSIYMNNPERSVYVITRKGEPFDPEKYRNKPIDALYMIREQKERRPPKSKMVEVPVPCPHCGQFQTLVIVQNE